MSTLLTIIITVMTFFSLLIEAIPLPLKRVEDVDTSVSSLFLAFSHYLNSHSLVQLAAIRNTSSACYQPIKAVLTHTHVGCNAVRHS
ncbi:hypothetical protein L596_013572 [Steinernema carpocapsae]|uniref:CNNM transmembrane domain-containing protein n=1 Tax=Steinernema carpocapsae TaxID=34508 RepID=A0A4U5P1F7_STECR|nr:hypothetical protein L596_013572 [Steinernema carpocapsae]